MHRLVMLETCSSTMHAARDVWSTGDVPTWVMTFEQTAGRGRRGRSWVSSKGMLAATLIYQPIGSIADAALRSFVAANAVYDAIKSFAPTAHVSLKWPNDVLVDGKKIAGILLESIGNQTVDNLLIGIGLNLHSIPDLPDATFQPVGMDSIVDTQVTALDMLTAIANAFAHEEDRFVQMGFSAVRERWLSRAAFLGQTIHVKNGGQDVSGMFSTLTKDGELLIDADQGPVRISAGDVFFGEGA